MKTALQTLTSLKEVGLVHLGISADDFHQEFVALEKVKTAVLAAIEMDITCYVQCAETKISRKLEDFQMKGNRKLYSSFQCCSLIQNSSCIRAPFQFGYDCPPLPAPERTGRLFTYTSFCEEAVHWQIVLHMPGQIMFHKSCAWGKEIFGSIPSSIKYVLNGDLTLLRFIHRFALTGTRGWNYEWDEKPYPMVLTRRSRRRDL